MSPRSLRRLYIAVAIVAIIPIWCVRYLPTVDGPSHVYNSWILHELVRGAHGPIADWFRIDWRPHPNWIGHAVMALLMFVVSPIIAEKLLVTGIVLLFLHSLWRYAGAAGEEGQLFAFLGVPFAYHLMLQNGFYNFSVGAGLYFLIVAEWWRRRDRPNARTIALIATLLLLCYFSHALPVVLAIGSIGLLWLITLRGRPPLVHARHLIAFLPVLPLLLWFRSVGAAYLRGFATTRGELLRFMARMRILYAFDERQLVYTTAIAILLAALIVATLVRRRWKWSERDAFVGVSIAVVFIYIASAAAVADVQSRMSLFVALTPLAWLDLRLPRRATTALSVALAMLAFAYSFYIIDRYRYTGSYVKRFVRSGDAIGERSTFLPVLYEIGPPDTFVPLYFHAIDYMALKKEAVDITNYEPVLAYFPIGLRPDVEPGNILAVGNPWKLNIEAHVSRAQYIFTWRMDADPELPGKLAPYYVRVGGRDSGAVYRATGSIADAVPILLPLLGTTVDHGAPGGMTWRVEQSVRNTGPAPVMLLLHACEPAPCRIDLAPNGSAPIAENAPYAYVSVSRSDAANVQFTTVVRRVDTAGNGASVSVPAVREDEFRAAHLEIDAVPFADPSRVTLRVWTRGERPQSVLVTLRDAAGRTLATKQLALDGHGAGTLVDVVHDFGDVAQRREPVRLAVDAGKETKVWGFVSAVEPNLPAPVLYLPR
jgi:hypothetical protein